MKIERVDQKVWFKDGAEIWSYDLADLSAEGQRRKKSQSSTPDLIIAQMPGKITKVFVKEGDSVTQGQALLVMEAMKMEYTLKSEIDGEIKNISCKVLDQVALGKVIVQIG